MEPAPRPQPPGPICVVHPGEFGDITQYYAPHAIALDATGKRFTDESESELEETLTQDTATLASGRAYYVLDQIIYERKVLGEVAANMFERAVETGARVVTAESLDELGEVLNGWGVGGDQAIRTVRSFNEAMRKGKAERLQPPCITNRRPVDQPPFWVIEVQPGITMTVGGLDVTTEMAVIRRTSSSSSLAMYTNDIEQVRLEPIQGLYAAGADVGNIQYRHYVGGLAIGLVTGMIVGDRAAKPTKEASE